MICTENGSTTQKTIFARIITIQENAHVVQTGDLEPVVKLRKQHNHVKPAVSEYKGNCEGLVDSQPGQSKATQITCLFSTPSYLREAKWSQCTSSLIRQVFYMCMAGVHRRSLTDWLTANVGPRTVGLNSPRCRTPKSHTISSRSPKSCTRPCWCGEERRHKWRAVEEEEASTSGPLQRGLLTWGIAAAL